MSEYGHNLEFNNEGLATCPESGDTYRLENDAVVKL